HGALSRGRGRIARAPRQQPARARLCWRSLRDSNPCFRLERVASQAVAIAGMSPRPSAEQHFVTRPSGGQVAFGIEGNGPLILMIPSLGRPTSDFDDLSRRLVAAGFTAARPDPRG